MRRGERIAGSRGERERDGEGIGEGESEMSGRVTSGGMPTSSGPENLHVSVLRCSLGGQMEAAVRTN
jgi:hypothetical protein